MKIKVAICWLVIFLSVSCAAYPWLTQAISTIPACIARTDGNLAPAVLTQAGQENRNIPVVKVSERELELLLAQYLREQETRRRR